MGNSSSPTRQKKKTRKLFHRIRNAIPRINLIKFFKSLKFPRKNSPMPEHKYKNVQRDRMRAEYSFEDPIKTMADSKTIRAILRGKNKFKQMMLTFNGKIGSRTEKCLPQTSRAPLVKCAPAQTMQIIEMSSGRYLQFGLEKAIRQHSKSWFNGRKQLTVGVYVHEVKCPQTGFVLATYVILLGRLSCETNQSKYWSAPFLIGVYQGSVLALSGNEIFQPFVAEMEAIGKQKKSKPCDGNNNNDNDNDNNNNLEETEVVLRAFVVDPIAHSLLTCTPFPNASVECSKCRLSGQMEFNKSLVRYPIHISNDYDRTDSDYVIFLDTSYHMESPILLQLRIGMVSQVIIDYKHSICDGVMKYLWHLWTKGKLDYRLNRNKITRINENLVRIGNHVSKEFRCGPKSFDTVDSWDPYDWRQFLLYYGPYVLEPFLSAEHYVNFLHLHIAIRQMVAQKKGDSAGFQQIALLLQTFVTRFAQLYGDEMVDRNIHGLLHYIDVLRCFGCLDDYCGFVFDDELQPFLERLTRRSTCDDDDADDVDLETIRQQYIDDATATNPNRPAKTLQTNHYFYRPNHLILNGFNFSTKHPDNYVITPKGVVKLLHVRQMSNGEVRLLCQMYKQSMILVCAPLLVSKCFHISEADLEPDVIPFTVSDVLAKGVRIETENGICVVAQV